MPFRSGGCCDGSSPRPLTGRAARRRERPAPRHDRGHPFLRRRRAVRALASSRVPPRSLRQSAGQPLTRGSRRRPLRHAHDRLRNQRTERLPCDEWARRLHTLARLRRSPSRSTRDEGDPHTSRRRACVDSLDLARSGTADANLERQEYRLGTAVRRDSQRRSPSRRRTQWPRSCAGDHAPTAPSRGARRRQPAGP
jgi:hypothetical protein